MDSIIKFTGNVDERYHAEVKEQLRHYEMLRWTRGLPAMDSCEVTDVGELENTDDTVLYLTIEVGDTSRSLHYAQFLGEIEYQKADVERHLIDLKAFGETQSSADGMFRKLTEQIRFTRVFIRNVPVHLIVSMDGMRFLVLLNTLAAFIDRHNERTPQWPITVLTVCGAPAQDVVHDLNECAAFIDCVGYPFGTHPIPLPILATKY